LRLQDACFFHPGRSAPGIPNRIYEESHLKLTIDTTAQTLTEEENGETRVYDLYSRDGFERLSRQWVRVGWNQSYPYTFTWLGRPIIQLPEDMVRLQEVLYRVRPDVIVETGVAHGGSLIYYASLCKVMGKGRVIGVDIEIRPHNRKAIEAHEMSAYITLIEGDAIAETTVEQVRSLLKPGETVLIILDSCHTKSHVAQELERYSGLVTPGSYIVATDGIMYDLHDVPRGNPEWTWDHPTAAAAEFAERHPEFVLEQPEWPFNESELRQNITHWPGAWLRRK
jgi:cephalosporin hydroxylase